MVDPDVPAPSSALRGNYLHWAYYNAQPDCNHWQSPVTAAIYQPPSPPSFEEHRYTFLVYRQPAGFALSITDLALLNTRVNFNLNKFVLEKGLRLVGGNFFRQGLTTGFSTA